MADSALVNQIVGGNDQRAASQAQQDQLATNSQNQAALGQGQGFDPSQAPGYGGVKAKTDFGFEQFQSHHLDNTTWSSTNPLVAKALDGPYAGMTRSQMLEKTRDDYQKMSPEQRAPYEARRFNQDVRSDAEKGDQGFQYKDQTQQWGDKSAPNSADGDTAPAYSGAVPHPENNMVVPPVGASGLGNNDTRPHYGIGSAATSISNPSQHQADAIPAGQQFTKVGLNSIPNAVQPPPAPSMANNLPPPTRPAIMGDRFDEATSGPRMTGSGTPAQARQTAVNQGLDLNTQGFTQAPAYTDDQLAQQRQTAFNTANAAATANYKTAPLYSDPASKTGGMTTQAPPARVMPTPAPAYAGVSQ